MKVFYRLTQNLKKYYKGTLKKLKCIPELMKEVISEIWGEAIFVSLVIAMILVKKYFFEDLSNMDQPLLQNFIEWFAVIYSLVLTVIIGHAWKKYSNINNEIDREADSLVLVVQTSKMFKGYDNLTKGLLLAIKRYAKYMIFINAKDKRQKKQSLSKLENIQKFVELLIIESKGLDCLKSDLLHHFNQSFDARGDRFDLIEMKLPNHVWIIFIITSLLWLWGFLWLNFESKAFESYVLGSAFISVSYLFYLARALNDPTKGIWKMRFDSFKTHIFK